MQQEEYIKIINNLQEENKRLKKLLKDNNIDYEDTKFIENKSYTKEEKINIYSSYFKFRVDQFREQYIKKDGTKGFNINCYNRYTPICDYKNTKCLNCKYSNIYNLDNKILEKHFKGEITILGYPIINNKYTNILAFDFDDESFKEDALAIKKAAISLGLSSILELSSSGSGLHLWLFFKEVVLAKSARLLGDKIISKALDEGTILSFSSFDRMYPNQDDLKKDGFGNGIILPLSGKMIKEHNTTVFVNDYLIPYSNQIEALENVEKIDSATLESLIKESNLVEIIDSKYLRTTLKNLKIKDYDFNKDLTIILDSDIILNINDFSPKALNIIKRLATIYNPRYYELKRLKKSLKDCPRFISYYKIENNTISIPRGLLDDLLDILSIYNVKYNIKSLRINSCVLNNETNNLISLLPDQTIALDNALSKDGGLICAYTGFGKTVLGMAICERIVTKTLIIVHNLTLANQWKKEILEKLPNRSCVILSTKNIEKSDYDIGIITIQTLANNLNILDLFSLVLVDEVHHYAATTYVPIIRNIKAKYLYGFTGTLIRSDNLVSVLYKLFGKVLYEKKEDLNYTFTKKLQIKFTNFKDKDEYFSYNFTDLCSELYQNEERNNYIINDIKKLYQENKNILVLTTRIEHVNILYDSLSKQNLTCLKVFGTTNKQDKLLFENKLKNLSSPYVIISTGGYLGEGFNLPSLNTLVVAMPIKWKGKTIQYIGRIEREYNDKNEVLIVDYVDFRIKCFNNMFKERLKVYKNKEYIIDSNSIDSRTIYSSHDYYNKLVDDLTRTNKVIFAVDYYKEEVLEKLINAINIIPTIYSKSKIQNHNTNIKRNICDNLIIINDDIIWYGSINPFSYAKEDDMIMRLKDSTIVKEFLNYILKNKPS